MVQWLRLCIPNAGGLGSIPGCETRSHTWQLRKWDEKDVAQISSVCAGSSSLPLQMSFLSFFTLLCAAGGWPVWTISRTPYPGSLGSANGDVGRRSERDGEKGQNSNSASSLLVGHFGKDCNPAILWRIPLSLSDSRVGDQVLLGLGGISSLAASPGCFPSIPGWGPLTWSYFVNI